LFVGRSEELGLLVNTFESVKSGKTATVLVAGDAGIGKSRLVEELCDHARLSGAGVASGSCVPIDGGGLPYGPVVGVLRDVVRLMSRLDTGAAASVPAIVSVPDELAKTRLFESVLASIVTLAQHAPVVIALEDLQWADSASAELLGFLVRNLADDAVLIVGTYRGDEIGRHHHLRAWLSEFSRHSRVREVQLDGLDREGVAAMIAGIVGRDPDWTLVDAVFTRSQGNAFFVEELTAARHSQSIPPELQRLIMTRVESLSPLTQHMLGEASASGLAVTDAELVAAGGLDEHALEAALTEAIDAQVLVMNPPADGYRFRHALVREAVYASLLPSERRRAHLRLATALSTHAAVGPIEPVHRTAEIAAHWWAAGEWKQALTASTDAADAAIAVWAYPEALTQMERALSALDHLSPEAAAETDRIALLEKTLDVAYMAGEGGRAIELTHEAIAAVDDADPSALAALYATLGRNAWVVGDSDAAFDAYRRAAALLPADTPSLELARVIAEEARGLMLMSRFAEAERRCHDAVEVARACGARAEEGHALNTLGCSVAGLGFYDRGIELVREAVAVAHEVGHADDLARAYTNLSSLLVDAGRLEEGVALVADVLADGDGDCDRSYLLNGTAGNAATALIRMGRYHEAEDLIAKTGTLGGGICALAPMLVPLPIEIRRGRFTHAHQMMTEADEATARLLDVQTRGLYHMLRAELALEEERPDEAFIDVERARVLAATSDDLTFTPEMCALGLRALSDGIAEPGRRRDPATHEKVRLLAHDLVCDADRLAAAATAGGGQCPPRVLALAAQCRAEASRLDVSEPEAWRVAAEAWAEASEPHPLAYCRWREAEAVLESRGDRNRAAAVLEDAWRTTVDLDAVPLREQVERLARRARISIDAGDPSPQVTAMDDLGLTPRETEVLAHLAMGRTDGEIADALFISKKTASVHVSNLLRKLDVANRVEAGKVGAAMGMGV
jgi:DNA-binding CsgD family transcriptional regulator/tetratricopeptide (TPR) repeat protein